MKKTGKKKMMNVELKTRIEKYILIKTNLFHKFISYKILDSNDLHA